MSTKFKFLFVLMAALGVFLTLEVSNAFACSRFLNELIPLKVKIADLQQFEQHESDRYQRNKFRNRRMQLIQRARIVEGNYVKCFENRKGRMSGSQKRAFVNSQKQQARSIANNSPSETYNFGGAEAVDYVGGLLRLW